MEMEEKREQRIEIELPEHEGEGIYSNFAIVSHSAAEFVIDFTRILPGIKKTKVYARIILSPMHTKMLMNTIKENIEKYEQKFGEIKIEKEEQRKIGF